MVTSDRISLYVLGALLIGLANAKCPSELPHQVDIEYCYAIKFDTMSLDDARKKCADLEEGAELAVVHDSSVIELLFAYVFKFIDDKTKTAYYWVGMEAEKPPAPGEQRGTDKRRWIFNIDGSKVIEEDYELWRETPNDKLSCAVINGTDDFMTVASDCGGNKFPVICQKHEDPCYDDNKPYFTYDDMCLAVIPVSMEHYKTKSACEEEEGVAASIKNKHEKELLVNAAQNGFLGGALFTSLAKLPDGSWKFSDGSTPNAEDWESGEPRDRYECAGLSMQRDYKLKFRTTNCDNLAGYVCSYKIDQHVETTEEPSSTQGTTTEAISTEKSSTEINSFVLDFYGARAFLLYCAQRLIPQKKEVLKTEGLGTA